MYRIKIQFMKSMIQILFIPPQEALPVKMENEMKKAYLVIFMLLTAASVYAGIDPLITTEWGQDGVFRQSTPLKNGSKTYPGCTSIAAAQIIYYYRYKSTCSYNDGYVLEHSPMEHEDIEGNYLYKDLTVKNYDFTGMTLNGAGSPGELKKTADFIYDVSVTLNAQFGGGQGSSALGRQIENAFKYYWGFNKTYENNIYRRSGKMKIGMVEYLQIPDGSEGYRDVSLEEYLYYELDRGRPVMYMAQQSDAGAGHAFIIDGYNDSGLFHVNWGWGGYGNGYYDTSFTDPSNRSWSRDAMVFCFLEPENGYAKTLLPGRPGDEPVEVTVQKSGTVSKDEWVYYGPYTNRGGFFSVTMTGSGDADVYVGKNRKPTVDVFDGRPYEEGSNENCSISGTGEYYVAVSGYAMISEYSLIIKYLANKDGGNSSPDDGIDLIISSLTIDRGEIQVDEKLKIDVLIKNTGKSGSSECKLKYFLSVDNQLGADDIYLNYDNIESLSAGETAAEYAVKTVSQKIIDKAGGPGSYFIIVVVDTENTNAEVLEDNNTLSIPIVIK